MHYGRINRHFNHHWTELSQGAALLIGFIEACIFGVELLWRIIPYRPERRRFLQVARTATLAAPVAVTGYGVYINRARFRIKESRIVLPNLPKDLNGLRIAQLSDIHLSAFLSAKEFAPAVDMANEVRPHLTFVTGDLITRRGDPLDACLAELARLKADAGVYGCLGNHEIYADSEDYTAEQAARIGIKFLRSEARALRFGRATLNLAGVDYQEMRKPYLIGAEQMVSREPETLNLLLSHNPDVFPVAARQGYDLTIAGHTHGGQVTVEILRQYANIARIYTPYISGLYREGERAIYVSEGIGTIGMPLRLGTQAEVGVITLCST